MTNEEARAWRNMSRDLRMRAADCLFDGHLQITMNRSEFKAAMFSGELVGQRDKNKNTFYFVGLEVIFDKGSTN